MAIVASIATGNWLTSGTWGLVDGTLYSNSETSSVFCPTSYSSAARSAPGTPGAITISHIGIKLSNRSGTTGTITVHLALNTSFTEVLGTAVTIDMADLPAATSSQLNGGWQFFKLATPVTLTAATSYVVEVQTSNANQCTVFASAATNGLSCALITTTNQAPAAGDDVIITGEYTGSGTSNTFRVTMDETANTDYGSASTSLVTPAISVCNKGELLWETNASTNYRLRVSGNIVLYAGAKWEMGSVGDECPRDSSMTLVLDCGTNVEFGLVIRNLATFNAQGLSRSSGKNIVSCLLNTDEAVNQTTIGVDTDTGWLDNDYIAISSTTQTFSQGEHGTLNGNAGASTMNVDGFGGSGGGLGFAHSGTAPTQAEVILLTRNVVIRGTSASLQTYIVIENTAEVDFDWVEFRHLGSNTTAKRGINLNSTSGTASFSYCSFYEWEVNTSTILIGGNTSLTGITFEYCNFYRISSFMSFSNPSSIGSNWTITRCIFMRNLVSTPALNLMPLNGTFTYNTMCSLQNISYSTGFTGIQLTGTFENLTFHSNSGAAFNINGGGGTMSNITYWRCASFNIASQLDMKYVNLTIFGCSSLSIILGSYCDVIIENLISNGDTTFSTTKGIGANNNAAGVVKIINGDFSTVSGIKTAHTDDLDAGGSNCSIDYKVVNTKFGGTNHLSRQTNLSKHSMVSSRKHNQTAGSHKTWKRDGTIEIETTTVHAGGHSMKLTPISATNKLESSGRFGGFKVAVSNGATVTPTVYVYEDASYNGNRARLIVKQNYALGITSDTVLDTATAASDEAWEALTGTTAAVTDDGVLEFVVDCDGTAGNLFVDSFSAA